MRVLHLLDPATCADEGLLACAAAIRAIPAARHHCWIVGSGTDEQRCWSLGILTTDRVSPRRAIPFGSDATCAALRRLHATRSHPHADRPDLIQCWSLDALHLARHVFGSGPGAPARCAVLPRPPHLPQRSLPSDSDLATAREVLAAFDDATRIAIAPLASGAGESEADRWLPTIRRLPPPCFDHGGPVCTDRAALRRSLGIKPEDTVIALLADPPTLADAHRASFALGVLRAVGHRATLLLRRTAMQERRAVAYVAAHARRWGLVLTDAPLWEIASAADLGLIDAVPTSDGVSTPTCGPIGASLALSIGLPIVTFPGVLPGWPVLAAPSHNVGRLAVPISGYLENPRIRTEYAAAARAFCDRARAADGFGHTLEAIWREQLNVPSSDVSPALVR